MTQLDEDRALQTLMQLLTIEGLSGQEQTIAGAVGQALIDAGVPADAISHDRAHTRIGQGFQVGNLQVRLPGTRRGKRRLFSTHLDTVPLCVGAVPVRRNGRIVSSVETALGGDDRTGVACLIEMVRTLLAHQIPHPPLLLLFTVGEETGLHGARHIAQRDLRGIELGFNVDGGAPADFTTGGIGSHTWEVQIQGMAAHAGAHPERGVSAAAITALALADVHRGGWFGKIIKGNQRGTSNVGTIEGGQATNEVTPAMRVRGESRSHSKRFLDRITGAYRTSFEKAAAQITNAEGTAGQARLDVVDVLPAFRLPKRSPVCQHAGRAARSIGLEPTFEICDGGLDANFLSQHVPTITFGAGQHLPHSVDEYIEVAEFLDGCRLAVALASGE